MKKASLLLLLAVPFAYGDDLSDSRARAALALSLADKVAPYIPAQVGEPKPKAVDLAAQPYDLSSLDNQPQTQEPEPAGEWRDVQVCNGNGTCHVERRWFPIARRIVENAAQRVANALDEVNALRVRAGLRPYIYDPQLEAGAKNCSQARAAALCFGHTSNDFSYLPPGCSASAAGCAAWVPEMGWGSCAIYDNYTYGGAAWTMGADGKRYMHLFVR